ncbi:MAG: tellurium resistance protein TerD [bacterium P3]|nr:MAG: tellurium resistance protein TerD [bacterium P3]KWW41799.1 MAG: tellurium resistance protein TerD [bacterium F083]
MAINLVKGQRIDIGLSKLTVELGWKVNPQADPPYDLDASTFLLTESNEIAHEVDFVFYGSPKKIKVQTDDGEAERPISNDNSVLGSIDDLGDDDDDSGEGNEEIEVDLTKTDSKIQSILFTASIYWDPSDANNPKLAPRVKYNFGQVRDSYILIKNSITGEELCKYELDEDFSTVKGVEFGRLYRRNGSWKFEAVGIGYADGLEPICKKYASKFM